MNHLNVSITPSYVVTLEYDNVADSFVFISDIMKKDISKKEMLQSIKELLFK